MDSYALLFCGQGSQYVGMGKSFLTNEKAQQLFKQANEALDFDIGQIMLEGPADELTNTAIAQPAILLHSLCSYTHVNVYASCALGHSLGEYSALVVAGVISFTDAIKAVHARGKFMQEAVPKDKGAMAAIIGLDPERVLEIMSEFNDPLHETYATCANFNGPMQTVIAGTKKGVDAASKLLKENGAKRVIPLQVSAPFHCELMSEVQEKMKPILESINFNTPKIPFISNVTAKAESDPNHIKDLLLEQIVKPIRFTECVNYVVNENLYSQGFIELGPKNVLTGIIKKINRSLRAFNIDSINDLNKLDQG